MASVDVGQGDAVRDQLLDRQLPVPPQLGVLGDVPRRDGGAQVAADDSPGFGGDGQRGELGAGIGGGQSGRDGGAAGGGGGESGFEGAGIAGAFDRRTWL